MKKYFLPALLASALWCSWAQAQTVAPIVNGVVTVDASVSRSFKVVVGATVTSVAIVNPSPGENISVLFIENATGGFGVTFGGNISNPCTVTTTANAVTACQFIYDAGNNQWNGSSGSSSGSTSSPSTAYTFSVSGSTVTATPNTTGLSTFSGTDAAVVVNNAITAAASTCGRLYFKNGIYNFNSLFQESTGGFTLFYAIGLPGSAASNQYCKWVVEGESVMGFVGEINLMPVQTSGVILNITPAAITSAGSTSNEVVGIWARPDAVNNIGATILLDHIVVRMPTNQRGCEAHIDVNNALDFETDNVLTDYNIAYSSLAFPVTGTSCVGGEPGGEFGITTTQSTKNDNWMKNTHAIGSDRCIDIRSEHTFLIHSGGQFCNHAIDYGVNGSSPIIHPSIWIDSGWGESARGLTLGANMAYGSGLTILSLDSEDTNGQVGSPAFNPVYHALETNAGFTGGLITYTASQQQTGVIHVPNFFDGGGGTSFTAYQSTSAQPIARVPNSDSFTRANNLVLGPPWGFVGGSTLQCSIISNKAGNATGACGNLWDSQAFAIGDQFSQATIGTVDANAVALIVRGTYAPANSTAQNFYEFVCTGTSRLLRKTVANVNTTLTSNASGCSNGQVIKLTAIGNVLDVYVGGVRDMSLQTTDSTFTNGQPGIILGGTGDTFSNWVGGAFPQFDNANSLFNVPHIAPNYFTLTNCNPGSVVSPAACGSAASGTVVVPTTTTTYTVSTTAVTPNSRITILPITDATGLTGAPTCTAPPTPFIAYESARTAGTSFTFTLPSTTGASCWTYSIMN